MIIQTPNLKSLVAGMGLVATLGMVPAAVAASDDVTTGEPIVLAQATTFDDAMIEAFAAAQTSVAELRAEYTALYEAAETDQQRAEISEAATQAMVAAVRETPGITVEDYDAVIQAANQDPQLVERINEVIAETIN